jgi:hypothetical protein
MTRQGQLDYLTVQVARLKNGAKLSKDSLDMMLWTLEDLSAKEANKRFQIIDKKTHVIYRDNMTSMIHSVPKNKEAT